MSHCFDVEAWDFSLNASRETHRVQQFSWFVRCSQEQTSRYLTHLDHMVSWLAVRHRCLDLQGGGYAWADRWDLLCARVSYKPSCGATWSLSEDHRGSFCWLSVSRSGSGDGLGISCKQVLRKLLATSTSFRFLLAPQTVIWLNVPHLDDCYETVAVAGAGVSFHKSPLMMSFFRLKVEQRPRYHSWQMF